MDPLLLEDLKEEYDRLSADGFRVLAIAYSDSDPKPTYSKDDEHNLILKGYVAFLDPPKETAAPAITALQQHGIAVKVLTGDNELVSRKICKEVGLPLEHVLTGPEVEGHERRRAGQERRMHNSVCASLARSQATHHQGIAEQKTCGRASWGTVSTTLLGCVRPMWVYRSIPP